MTTTDRLIHRVTVRGRFTDLSSQARSMLATNVDEHDVLTAAFTADGTLTYDAPLTFFTFRIEIRGEADDAAAGRTAVDRATTFLDVLGVGHEISGSSAINLTSMMQR